MEDITVAHEDSNNDTDVTMEGGASMHLPEEAIIEAIDDESANTSSQEED